MFLAPFVATPASVVRKMLILAELKPREVLYDLGSGDGRAVIMAAKDFGATSVGVELRDDLAQRALDNIQSLGLNEKTQILQKDILKMTWSKGQMIMRKQ